MSGAPPRAVVIGGYVNGLAAVRSLAAAGAAVSLVSTKPGDLAEYSRHTSETERLWNFHAEPSALLDLLERRRKEWGGAVLVATNDEALEALSQNRETLLRDYRVPAPPWDITRHVLDKNLTRQAAERVGISTPRFYGVMNAEQAQAAEVRFPVAVKPVFSHQFTQRFRKKLIVAADRRELVECLRITDQYKIAMMVMELIPGPDRHSHNQRVYINPRGDPLGATGIRCFRKTPPFFGIMRVCESWHGKELMEPTMELLRHIGWRGIATVEYKWDPRDNAFQLIEINGRCYLTIGHALRSGINYAGMIWREAATGDPGPAEPNGWNGIWMHLYDEVYWGWKGRKIEGFTARQYVEPYRQPISHAVWSRTDPRPFMVQWSRAARAAVRPPVHPEIRNYPEIFRRIERMPGEGKP